MFTMTWSCNRDHSEGQVFPESGKIIGAALLSIKLSDIHIKKLLVSLGSFRPILPAFLTLLLCVAVLGSCASKQPFSKNVDFPDIVDDMERKAYLVKQFRADFVKTRHMDIFNRDLTVNARLVFQKPGNFRLVLSGDVNVEILSDGKTINLIHDQMDTEVYRLHGDRDSSRFSDPLMLLIQNIGMGGLRKFAIVKNVKQDDLIKLEVEPGNDNQFEKIKRIALNITDSGEIQHVSIFFKDGNRDDTVFQRWSMLTADDPEIVRMNNRLQQLAKRSETSNSSPDADLMSPRFFDSLYCKYVADDSGGRKPETLPEKCPSGKEAESEHKVRSPEDGR